VQQFVAQGVVNAFALSVFANALGLIVAASEGIEVAPALLKATDPAINALRQAYGDEVVSKALADVPGAEAIKLAERVEYYVHQDLRQRYGDWAANIAIESAPPGDIRSAIEIAKVLSQRGVTPSSPTVEKARAVAHGRLAGRKAARPVRDTKTGVVYRSESAAGMAVAGEYGLPAVKPDGTPNSFVWYAVIKKDPNRFVPA
jgi:hypothetical protein